MKTLTLSNGKPLNVPSTAHDWQLYSSMTGVGVAARSMTSTFESCVRRMEKQYKEVGDLSALGATKMYREKLTPKMNKLADFGAADTEPRNVALDYLERAVKAITGQDCHIDGGW